MYDFSTLPPRRGTGSPKWAPLERDGVQDARVVPLSIADMDLLCPPQVAEALRRTADLGAYGYTSATDGYRAAVQGWMRGRHGWDIRPEWIVNTFGVVPAIAQAVHAFTRPGDGVLYQPPVYPPFRGVVESAGRIPVPNPLRRSEGRYEMDLDGLERLAARPEVKLLLLCSPHNPAGRVWTRAELAAVADICNRNGVLVFSDEIHFDFVYPPHTHTVYATLDEETAHNCVVGTSASKTFNLAGLATAGILIPDEALRHRFEEAALGSGGHFTGCFGLAAAQAAYESCGDWLDALLDHLRGNWAWCRDFLADRFPSVSVAPLEGTYLLWADFSSLGLDCREQERFMTEEARLYLDEGYRFGAEGDGFERFSLACPRWALEAAMERLDAAARRLGLPR